MQSGMRSTKEETRMAARPAGGQIAGGERPAVMSDKMRRALQEDKLREENGGGKREENGAEKGPDPGRWPPAAQTPAAPLSLRTNCGREIGGGIMAVAKGRCGPIPPRGGPTRKRRFPRMEGRTRLGRRAAHRFLSGDSSSRGKWTCRRSCIRPGTRVRRPSTPGNRLPGP